MRDSRPAELRGTASMVPILEGNGDARLGRFGWKKQHASHQSFAADDYLLHELGSGDGIPVLPTAATAMQMRTAPLSGLRTRNRLRRDGLSFTRQEAVQRHAGQAAGVTARYNALPAAQESLLMQFLDSL